MVIDGRKIAGEINEELRKEIKRRFAPPELCVILVGKNPVSEKFLAVKKKFAEDIGIEIIERRFRGNIDTLRLASEIICLAGEKSGGIVVQLPLPEHTDVDRVLSAIPPHKDPDMLSPESMRMFANGRARILPPVVGAIKEILERNNIAAKNKNVVIIGRGRLVGAPAEIWFTRQGGKVTVVDRRVPNIAPYTRMADIIVSGAGAPGLIRPEIIKSGAVLLDAGTNEAGSKFRGDAAPACAAKCSIFTPVPGGIGPITVAMLFGNLLELTKTK